MDEHECEQIFRSGPDYSKRDSAHRQDDDRIGNGVQSTWVRPSPSNSPAWRKIKPGACANPKMRDMSTMPLTSDLNAAASCDCTKARKKNSSTNPTSSKSQMKQSGKPRSS